MALACRNGLDRLPILERIFNSLCNPLPTISNMTPILFNKDNFFTLVTVYAVSDSLFA